MTFLKRRTCGAGRKRRQGTAVAELAVYLPVLVVLVLAAIECCSMIFLIQSLNVVAYEGVRIAIQHDSDNSMVTDRCDEVIVERNVQGATVTIDPVDVTTVERGEPIHIRVTAPPASNRILPIRFFTDDVEADAIMIKE